MEELGEGGLTHTVQEGAQIWQLERKVPAEQGRTEHAEVKCEQDSLEEVSHGHLKLPLRRLMVASSQQQVHCAASSEPITPRTQKQT